MSSCTHKVGNHYYSLDAIYQRKKPQHRQQQSFEKLLSLSSTVAVCPLGGPVAVLSGKHLSVFTPSFERLVIDSFDLTMAVSPRKDDAKNQIFLPSLVVGFWWHLAPHPEIRILLSEGLLICIPLFRTMTLVESHMTEVVTDVAQFGRDPIVAVSVFRPISGIDTCFTVLTQAMRFFAGAKTLLDFVAIPAGVGVVCFVQVSAQGELVVSLDDGSVVLVDPVTRSISYVIDHSGGVCQLMSVSYSGRYLALYSSEGRVSVFGIAQLSTGAIDSAMIDIGFPPSQLVWVGDDAVAVGFGSKTRNVVFVGLGAWTPFEYDTGVFLASDLGRAVVVTPGTYQVLRKMGSAALAVGETIEPAGQLVFAQKSFANARMEEAELTVRKIKNQLEKAVMDCVEAAGHYSTPSTTCYPSMSSLLSAAQFGRQFLDSDELVAADSFSKTVALIRVCADLNSRGIPIAVSQLQQTAGFDWRVLPQMLAARGEYLTGIKLAQWLGIPGALDSVFATYAVDLIQSSDHLTDADLCEMVVDRMQSLGVGSVAKVAAFANRQKRKKLAISLLEFEPDIKVQVAYLLKLGGALDEALSKALSSNRADLIHKCFDELIRLKLNAREIFEKFSTQHPLLVSFVSQRLMAESKWDEVGKLFPHSEAAAVASLSSVLAKNVSDKATPDWLQYAAERFSEIGNEFFPNLCASVLVDQSQLLHDQAELERTAAARGWPRGPHKFTTLPCDETLEKLILIGEEHLRKKMSEGRFWDLKAATLINADRIEELLQMPAAPNNDCAGNKAVAESLIAKKKFEIALIFIKKLKPKSQAKFYNALGMHEEARTAEAASRSVPGAALFGKIASGFLGR